MYNEEENTRERSSSPPSRREAEAKPKGGGHWQKCRKPRVRKYGVDFIQDT